MVVSVLLWHSGEIVGLHTAVEACAEGRNGLDRRHPP